MNISLRQSFIRRVLFAIEIMRNVTKRGTINPSNKRSSGRQATAISHPLPEMQNKQIKHMNQIKQHRAEKINNQ